MKRGVTVAALRVDVCFVCEKQFHHHTVTSGEGDVQGRAAVTKISTTNLNRYGFCISVHVSVSGDQSFCD